MYTGGERKVQGQIPNIRRSEGMPSAVRTVAEQSVINLGQLLSGSLRIPQRSRQPQGAKGLCDRRLTDTGKLDTDPAQGVVRQDSRRTHRRQDRKAEPDRHDMECQEKQF